ncbi:hypothetical protein CRI69_25350 [Escherichia sp. E4742]|nr:hypothetical protein CRI69_25350 [Escherichia sp. E4742]
MYHILMEIKAVRYIRDIVLDSEDDYVDIMVHYRCKTPLNESDTCAMICRYFESVYFDDKAGGDYFIPKKRWLNCGRKWVVFSDVNRITGAFR